LRKIGSINKKFHRFNLFENVLNEVDAENRSGSPVNKIKKWQVTYIAPLQPPILAAFLPWGGSAGAGRIRLAGAKVILFY